MNFLEVPILCYTAQGEQYAEMKIDMPDNYEVRTGCINLDYVTAFYPSAAAGETIVDMNGDTISVMLDYKEFKKLF